MQRAGSAARKSSLAARLSNESAGSEAVVLAIADGLVEDFADGTVSEPGQLAGSSSGQRTAATRGTAARGAGWVRMQVYFPFDTSNAFINSNLADIKALYKIVLVI